MEVVYQSFRPVTAEIDEVKLSLAITNLVENAIKYNREGGWVHVTLNADHKFCNIEVADSGIGIAQEETEHIFERFTEWTNPIPERSEEPDLGCPLQGMRLLCIVERLKSSASRAKEPPLRFVFRLYMLHRSGDNCV